MNIRSSTRSGAALSHPNICIIHEVDEIEGQTYIAIDQKMGTL